MACWLNLLGQLQLMGRGCLESCATMDLEVVLGLTESVVVISEVYTGQGKLGPGDAGAIYLTH